MVHILEMKEETRLHNNNNHQPNFYATLNIFRPSFFNESQSLNLDKNYVLVLKKERKRKKIIIKWVSMVENEKVEEACCVSLRGW
jgi:hypothetical protein